MTTSFAIDTRVRHPEQARSLASAVEILAIGPWGSRQFAIAAAQVRKTNAWRPADSIESAADHLANCLVPPELILLAQPLPGQTRQEDVDQLQRLAPLSRVVVVAGTWCEGEQRTGKRTTGTLHLYWYELSGWWRASLARLARHQCPLWSLPLDSTLAGRCAPTPRSQREPIHGTVLIDAHDFAVFDTLSAAFKTYGITTSWTSQGNRTLKINEIAAGIWDGGQLGKQELERLAHFSQPLRDAGGPVIALLDFPRVEHIARAHDAGATAVFGKPYIVDELIDAVYSDSATQC